MLCDLLAIAIATTMAAMATALAMRLAIAIATTIAANYYSMVTLNWGGFGYLSSPPLFWCPGAPRTQLELHPDRFEYEDEGEEEECHVPLQITSRAPEELRNSVWYVESFDGL